MSFNSEQVRQVSLGSQGYQIEITGTANGKGRAGANFNSSTISPLTVTQDCVDSGVLIPSSGVLGFVSGGAEVRTMEQGPAIKQSYSLIRVVQKKLHLIKLQRINSNGYLSQVAVFYCHGKKTDQWSPARFLQEAQVF